LKNYLYGSKALAQEQASNIPEIHWLGLYSRDLINLPKHVNDPSMPLTRRDRNTIVSMLDSQEWYDGKGNALLGLRQPVDELRQMLMLGRKAEIQSLDEMPSGLEDWLVERIGSKLNATVRVQDSPVDVGRDVDVDMDEMLF
jgi:DNA topoisomerase VI subunit A